MSRIIIAGSRDFEDYALLSKVMQTYVVNSTYLTLDCIISGTARGADMLGEAWALEHGIPVERYPADWSLGRRAGTIRNLQMANVADTLVAFWDGVSKGTKNMIDLAIAKGLYTIVVLNGVVTIHNDNSSKFLEF